MQIVRLKAAGSSRQSAASFFPIPDDTLVLLQAGTLIPDEVGGISVPDLNVGNVVKILPVDPLASSARVYLPEGHTYYIGGGKSETSDPFKVSMGGLPLTLTKTDTTEWAVW